MSIVITNKAHFQKPYSFQFCVGVLVDCAMRMNVYMYDSVPWASIFLLGFKNMSNDSKQTKPLQYFLIFVTFKTNIHNLLANYLWMTIYMYQYLISQTWISWTPITNFLKNLLIIEIECRHIGQVLQTWA